MRRLMKMELYRLFHAISTHVMIVVMAGVAVLMVLLVKLELSTMTVVERETTVEEIGTELGAILMSQLQSCLLVVFVAIFVPLFVNAEQKRGYIKNIAGQIPRREMLAFSKMPAVAVQVFVLLTVYSIAHLTAEAVLFRERIVWVSAGALLWTLCIQYVLHTAWGCLIAFFTIMTRSTAFAMTTGILLASGIAEMLLTYLNQAICAVIPSAERLNLIQYTLNYATCAATAQSTMRQLGGCAVVAVIYIVISAVLAGIVYRKRDVR